MIPFWIFFLLITLTNSNHRRVNMIFWLPLRSHYQLRTARHGITPEFAPNFNQQHFRRRILIREADPSALTTSDGFTRTCATGEARGSPRRWWRTAHFRITILGGKMYVENFEEAFQSRAVGIRAADEEVWWEIARSGTDVWLRWSAGGGSGEVRGGRGDSAAAFQVLRG